MAPPRRAAASLWLSVIVVLCSLHACDGNFAFPDFKSLDGLSLQGVANRTQSWLRLTPSVPQLVGSTWHRTKQSVVGGFRADFTFRIILDEDQAIPGPCKWVDHTPDSCARRGGDGLAFVVQNYGPQSLGSGGGGLGYGGIPNGIAVEFDTWFDASLRDPYENHLAVLTRGKSELRSEHGTHLGVCLDVPDLADGERHNVRVEYDPVFTPQAAAHPSFQASPHLADLVYPTAVGFRHGLGGGNRRTVHLSTHPVCGGPLGVGTMRVYVDDMSGPALTTKRRLWLAVPMNLAAFLELEGGTAWVGFTASTGESYQNHEIMSWAFYEHASESTALGAAAGKAPLTVKV